MTLTFGQPVKFFPAPLTRSEAHVAPVGFQGHRHAPGPDAPRGEPLLAFVEGFDDDGTVDVIVVDAAGQTSCVADVKPWDGSGDPPLTNYYTLADLPPRGPRAKSDPLDSARSRR